jgi:hypothetical protein
LPLQLSSQSPFQLPLQLPLQSPLQSLLQLQVQSPFQLPLQLPSPLQLPPASVFVVIPSEARPLRRRGTSPRFILTAPPPRSHAHILTRKNPQRRRRGTI